MAPQLSLTLVTFSAADPGGWEHLVLSLIHISEPTRQEAISYAVFANTTGRRSAASKMLVVKRTRSVTAVR